MQTLRPIHIFHEDRRAGLALVRLTGAAYGIIETLADGRQRLVKRGRNLGLMLGEYRRATGNHRITIQE